MVLVMIFVCLLTAGCGQTSGTSQEKEQADQSSEDKVHLSVWGVFDENTPGTYYVDLWDELAEKYGYEVIIRSLEDEDSLSYNRIMEQGHFEGALVLGPNDSSSFFSQLEQIAYPAVL